MQPSQSLEAIARIELETWERCAEEYVDGFGALVCQSIPFLLDAAAVTADSRVLDVGTGPGLVAAAVHNRKGTAIGIDYSQAMVRQARKNHPELVFRVGSADSLPFEVSEFDAVVSNFVFHHLAYPDKALSEAHRVLREGGKAALTIWSDREKLAGFGMFFQALEEHVDMSELPFGPLHGVTDFAILNAMMQEAGFWDIAVKEVDIGWRIPSIDTYLSVFRRWANLDAMPKGIKASIEDKVRQSAKSLETDGNLTLANPAILVSGTK